ncbi:MAG: hypothetical protein QM504_00980 [Pseudomonadota bacterium]
MINTEEIIILPACQKIPKDSRLSSSFSRNKVGLDIALEALREGWSARKFTMDELLRYAEICRVKKMIQPYIESLGYL